METIKVLWGSLKPNSMMGRAQLGGAVSMASISAIVFFNIVLTSYQEDKYKYTVCWDQFKELDRRKDHLDIYSPRKLYQAWLAYRECINGAKKGGELGVGSVQR